jgi:hypothetical protein
MRQIARLASLASLLCTLTSAAAWAAAAPVTVTFAHPEKYTDFRLSCVSRDTDARSLIDLTFRRLDGDGKALRAGSRKLRDSNYLVNAGSSSITDHLRYEKARLGDWLRHELGRGTRS